MLFVFCIMDRGLWHYGGLRAIHMWVYKGMHVWVCKCACPRISDSLYWQLWVSIKLGLISNWTYHELNLTDLTPLAPPRCEYLGKPGGRDGPGDVPDGDWQGEQEVSVSDQRGEILGPGGPRRHPDYGHREVTNSKPEVSNSSVCRFLFFSFNYDLNNQVWRFLY